MKSTLPAHSLYVAIFVSILLFTRASGADAPPLRSSSQVPKFHVDRRGDIYILFTVYRWPGSDERKRSSTTEITKFSSADGRRLWCSMIIDCPDGIGQCKFDSWNNLIVEGMMGYQDDRPAFHAVISGVDGSVVKFGRGSYPWFTSRSYTSHYDSGHDKLSTFDSEGNRVSTLNEGGIDSAGMGTNLTKFDSDGKHLWAINTPAPAGPVRCVFTDANNHVVTLNETNFFGDEGTRFDSIHKWDKSTGKELLSAALPLGSYDGSHVAFHPEMHRLYLVGGDRLSIHAIDTDTGNGIWTVRLPDTIDLAGPFKKIRLDGPLSRTKSALPVWFTQEGRMIEGDLISINGSMLTLRGTDGKDLSLSLKDLSLPCQGQVADHMRITKGAKGTEQRPELSKAVDAAVRTSSPPPDAMEWTSKAGTKIKAQFVGLDGEAVVLKRDGKEITAKFSDLTPASVAQAKAMAKRVLIAPGGAKPIDLLAIPELTSQPIHGKWVMEKNGLVVQGTPNGLTRIPITPNGDYELEIDFTRTSGSNHLIIVLPLPKGSVALLVGGDGGHISHVKHRETKVTDISGIVTNGRRSSLRISFSKDARDQVRIVCTIDGKAYFDWNGSAEDLNENGYWAIRNPPALGLGVHDSSAIFHRATLRMKNGQAKPMPPR